MKRWQLQEAKARFSEVVKSSQTKGPQEITLHGKSAAVVVSKDDYERLSGRRPSLLEFLRKSPLVGLRLRLERDKSPARDVAL